MKYKIQDHTSDGKGFLRITDDAGASVCDLFPFGKKGGVGLTSARENAAKIVSALWTYDALQGLIDWVDEGCPEGGHYALHEAKEAIKRARL